MSTFKEKLASAWSTVKKGLSKAGEFVVEHKEVFYYVGGFVFGCIAGKVVARDEYADDMERLSELEKFEPTVEVAKRFIGAGATAMCNWHIGEDAQPVLSELLPKTGTGSDSFPGHEDDTVVGITFHTKEGGDNE